MSYRKITVDGKEYQYVIGPTHTKVKGLGVWDNESVAPKITVHRYCECGCGERMADLYGSDLYPPVMKAVVMPKHISALIRTHG